MSISTGVDIDRRQESLKILLPLNSGPLICVEFQISSKLKLLQLVQNYGQVLAGVKFDRRRESQKTIFTIEFTTLTLFRVRNCIKIEAFAFLRPKLWPNRWQVPN